MEPSRVEAKPLAFLVGILMATCVLGLGLGKVRAAQGHLVPADKGLDPAWISALPERGDPEAYAGRDLLTIGMPVGGIGAGQLYLRGDGTLGRWWIFNRLHQTGRVENYVTYRPESDVDQGFAVTAEADGRRLLRRLDAGGFPGVQFLGQYPIGTVRYAADDFPLRVEMEAFSPFVPLSALDSALPATVFSITVENATARPLSAGVLGWQENAVLHNTAYGVRAARRSRVVRADGRTLVVHTVEPAELRPAPDPRPTVVLADFEGADYGGWTATGRAFGAGPLHGTQAGQSEVSGFLGQGLASSFPGSDRPSGTLTSPPFTVSRRYVSFLVGGGAHAGQTCVNLLVDGKVVRTTQGRNSERLAWTFWDVSEFAGREAQVQVVDNIDYGWGHIMIDQVELTDAPQGAGPDPLQSQEDYGSMVLALAGPAAAAPETARLLAELGAPAVHGEEEVTYAAVERRSAALAAAPVRLEPGARHTFVFVLAWHFPNHRYGRLYAERFADAPQAANYVLDNLERLAGDTRLWRRTFYEDSTLPCWLLSRLHSTAANLASDTCEWWADGRFWAWEGVGCCEGTCTHVWNYAQAHAALFPEIGRAIRRTQDFGVAFNNESGLVGHRGTAGSGYAADGQCGSILKAYREHLNSADDAFLRETWPRIKKALEYSLAQDGNDDGLLEGRQPNTYDVSFYGANTFVGSLYLAALRAGEEMAKEMGDAEFAARCRRVFESGSRLSVERLWDGEYFVQQVDLSQYPRSQYGPGCLSDQLFGQAWAHQLGLGYLYPPDKVRGALGAVWKYNWAPDVGPGYAARRPSRYFARAGEAGLILCTWPKSAYLPDGVAYRNEVWTGIEYEVAGHMAREGMVTEALAICRAIHERYHPSKHNPYNEVECGDHYARALASWGVYTALTGFEYNGPKGHIGFAPRLTADRFRAAFTAAEGWGSFSQERRDGVQRNRLEVRWGRLRLRTLTLETPPGLDDVQASIGGRRLAATVAREGARLTVTLADDVTIAQGQALEVNIR